VQRCLARENLNELGFKGDQLEVRTGRLCFRLPSSNDLAAHATTRGQGKSSPAASFRRTADAVTETGPGVLEVPYGAQSSQIGRFRWSMTPTLDRVKQAARNLLDTFSTSADDLQKVGNGWF